MKSILCIIAWLGTSALAHAQVLPVPNARNPDWVLDKTTLGFRPSRPDTLAGSRDRMPIADLNRQNGTASMPNVLGKSITSIGDTHRYWDAARQLSYEWQSHAGLLAPDSLVLVKQQATGATFTYRRTPKQWKARQDPASR